MKIKWDVEKHIAKRKSGYVSLMSTLLLFCIFSTHASIFSSAPRSQDNEERLTDIWIGKWNFQITYIIVNKTFDMLLQVTRVDDEYYIDIDSPNSAIIASINETSLEFNFDDDINTNVKLRLTGPDAFVGRLTIPNERPNGNIVGERIITSAVEPGSEEEQQPNRINGTDENDQLTAGHGKDEFTGGKGNDTFSFNYDSFGPNDPVTTFDDGDRITDYELGERVTIQSTVMTIEQVKIVYDKENRETRIEIDLPDTIDRFDGIPDRTIILNGDIRGVLDVTANCCGTRETYIRIVAEDPNHAGSAGQD